MSLFIIRPRVGVRTRSVSLAGRKLSLLARNRQIADVADLNLGDPAQQEIRKWIADHPEVKDVSAGETEAVLGLHIVAMSADMAGQFDRDVPDAQAVMDRPVDLIRPDRSSQSESQEIPSEKQMLITNWRDEWTCNSYGFDGRGVTVAVLDTGVQADHPEFGGDRITGGFTFDLTTGIAQVQAPVVDTDTHGTHVAGLICGRTVGAAPGASVLSGVMIPYGRGSVASFLIAMAWAAQRPEVQIVHLSAGLPGYVPEMRDAVDALRACGVLTVAAIGNDGRNLTRSPGNFAEVMSVGSIGVGTSRRIRLSPFSSTGQMVVDNHSYPVPRTFAPGEEIRSCVPGGGYDNYSGTSMAAPQITGVAARLIEKNPSIQLIDLFAEIDDLLMSSVRHGRMPVEFAVRHPEFLRDMMWWM